MVLRILCALWILLFAGSAASFGQVAKTPAQEMGTTDILEILVRELHIKVTPKKPGEHRLSFSVIPVSASSAGGNKILVSSINVAFTLGSPDSTNVSNVYFLPYTDFYQNFGFGSKANIWTRNNQWNFPGEFRISSLNQYSYGLGGQTNRSDQFKVAFNNVRLYYTANKRIKNYLYGGLGVNYDRYYKVSVVEEQTTPNALESYNIGSESESYSSGLTLNVLHDSRRNSLNPDNGFYYSIVYRFNPTFMKNEYAWTSLYADTRKYISLDPNKRKILALWGFYWGSYGDVPYFNLPGTQLEFGTRSGRGYSLGRFRGKQMLYAESEYRFDITDNKLLGGVIFVNAQSLAEPVTNHFKYINPAAGFGARIKFNKEANTNLTLDFGFGKSSFNFYIGLGEFF